MSHWNGRSGLNNWSIGVELDNAGRMERVGEKYVAWFGKEYGASEVMLVEHKHGGGVRPWHVYSEGQIARATELAELLVKHYALADVLGHEDIARGRKQDPGPAFPLAAIAKRVLGRQRCAGALRGDRGYSQYPQGPGSLVRHGRAAAATWHDRASSAARQSMDEG